MNRIFIFQTVYFFIFSCSGELREQRQALKISLSLHNRSSSTCICSITGDKISVIVQNKVDKNKMDVIFHVVLLFEQMFSKFEKAVK